MERLPPPVGRRAHRPPHRLRNLGHERRSSGPGSCGATRPTPAAAPSTGSRRFGPGGLRLRARDPDAPGAGRRADPLLRSVPAGGRRPEQHHFDTTRANVEAAGAGPSTCRVPEALRPAAPPPFKGNMDVEALEAHRARRGRADPLVMLTVTNNTGGGQPVSMANIREVSRVCRATGSRSTSMPAASRRTPISSSCGRRGTPKR
jgi:hypothetical protein